MLPVSTLTAVVRQQLRKETWTRVWDGDGGAEAESEKRELTLLKAQQLEGSVVKVE